MAMMPHETDSKLDSCIFDREVILPGIPAYSSRGFLGWCNVSLLTFAFSHGTKIYALFDTGNIGDRAQLVNALKKKGISAETIDYVFLSHLHYDHSLNMELFKNAKYFVSKEEVEYL